MKLKLKLLIFIFTCLLSVQSSFAEFDHGKAGFSLTIVNETYPYREFATYVLPKEHIGLCINAADPAQYEILADNGELIFIADCRWTWIAPAKTGITHLKINNKTNTDSISLSVFVMTPAVKMKKGMINGVKIGVYPEPIDNSLLYQKPDGFIKVTAELVTTPVSPHFVLGQFVTPLDKKFPKHIVLRERLLLKLESLFNA